MPQYELRYLCGRDVREIVTVPGPDEAESLARRRLLFREPGFAIAILCEGVELHRLIQRSKRPPYDGEVSTEGGGSPTAGTPRLGSARGDTSSA